jgi:hypothetical protein
MEIIAWIIVAIVVIIVVQILPSHEQAQNNKDIYIHANEQNVNPPTDTHQTSYQPQATIYKRIPQKIETPTSTVVWIGIAYMVAIVNLFCGVVGGIYIFSNAGFVGYSDTINPIDLGISIALIAEGLIVSSFLFLAADMAKNIARMRVAAEKSNTLEH